MCDALLHKVHAPPFWTIFLLSVRFKGQLTLVCFVALTPVCLCFLAFVPEFSLFPPLLPLPSVKPAFYFVILLFAQSLHLQTELCVY